MSIRIKIKDVDLIFSTSERVFSPRKIDRGTLAMLSTIEFIPDDRVLDLGCGYGVVGILAARLIGSERVFMIDNDPFAVELARRNAELNQVPDIKIIVHDGLKGFEGKDFTLILSNPPYHQDFSVPKGFIEEGFKRLRLAGRMVMVVKRLDWYNNKLKSVFGGVKVEKIDEYYILTAEKRKMNRSKKAKKTTTRKHLKKQKFASKAKN